MKNKRKSGLAFQRWIRDWLQEKGWLVHNQTPAGRIIVVKGERKYVSQRNDIFGCWDLIAKKPDRSALYIQATSHKSLKEKIKQIDEVGMKYFKGDDVQIWLKRETGIIDIYNASGDNIGKIIRRKFFSSEGITYEF